MTYGWHAERTSFCIALFAFVLAPSLSAQTMDQGLTNRLKSEETSCVSTLRTLNVAEVTYWGGVDTKGYAGSLKELGPSGESLIDAVTASGKKDGYRFRLKPEHRVEHSPVRRYTITARPIIRLSNDQRSFFTDETGVIRFTTKNRDATVKDSAIE